MNVLEQIDKWGRIAPERVAHRSGGHSLQFGELIASSDSLARYLHRTVGDDLSPVVIVGHKEPELLIGFLGVVKAGHPYVPVDSATPEHRLRQIVEASNAGLVLTPPEIRAHVQSGVPSDADAAPGRKMRDPDQPVYIMFTSGSTGQPKGVVITLGCLTSFVAWMLHEHRFAGGGEVFLNQAPFAFDLSVMDLYLSLVTGGTLFSIGRDQIAQPKLLFQALAAAELTTWVSTPSFVHLCLLERRFGSDMLPRLRRFLFCGETLSPSVATQLLDRFPAAEVWNTYGPTEATVATTSVRIDAEMLDRYPTLPVGYPKPDSRVLLVDADRQPVPSGARGEIVIVGPNVSPGYLNRPDLTDAVFFQVDGVRAYRTGDWGHFEAGLLFFDGRIDAQVKLHGHRIELADVEANLRALPEVLNAVVVPIATDGRLDALAAFVTLRDSTSVPSFQTAVALRRHLAERLPGYMVPRVVRFVDAFPMTSNGKVDRHALIRMLA